VIKLQNWIVRLLKELQERRAKADAQDREWLDGAEMLFMNESGKPSVRTILCLSISNRF
jgi:hypothetical protein